MMMFVGLRKTIGGKTSTGASRGEHMKKMLGRLWGLGSIGRAREQKLAQAAWTGLERLEDRAFLSVAPTIGSLMVPANPVTRGDQVTLVASNVTDADGTVRRVLFYRDTNQDGVLDRGDRRLGAGVRLAGTDDFQIVRRTKTFTAGDNTVFAVATNTAGQSSDPASGVVTIADRPPEILKLVVPRNRIASGNAFVIRAVGVRDRDGKVTKVEFFWDKNGDGVPDPSAKLGEDDSRAGGWKVTVDAATAAMLPTSGDIRLLAVATDNSGSQSGVATLTIPAGAAPTLASLAAVPNPVARQSRVTLTALGASDSDGSVRRVVFAVDTNNDGKIDTGDTLLGRGKRADGDFVLTIRVGRRVVPGDYTVLAEAIDNQGFHSAAVSTVVTVT